MCDLDRVVAIAASGGAHSVALASDGAVHTWGLNAAGQLGDGTTDDRRRPAVVPGLERGVAAIAAGPTASFAILDDGTVLGWGHCLLPGPVRLGLHKLRPVVIEELHGVAAIVPGLATHLALTRQGTVLAWGRAHGAPPATTSRKAGCRSRARPRSGSRSTSGTRNGRVEGARGRRRQPHGGTVSGRRRDGLLARVRFAVYG